MGFERGLQALTGFLDLVANAPDADQVARALANGPLSSLGVLTTFIAQHDGQTLQGIGTYGFSPDFHARYATFPITYDWPAARAATENHIIVEPIETIFDEYPTLALDRPVWEPLLVDSGARNGQLVVVPIAASGNVLGVFGFISRKTLELSVSEGLVLEGLGSALALWFQAKVPQHTSTEVLIGNATEELPLVLNPRQVQILQLVAEGKSNTAIAGLLGFSLSTVKLDLNRAMRILRADTRMQAADRATAVGLMTPNGKASSTSRPTAKTRT